MAGDCELIGEARRGGARRGEARLGKARQGNSRMVVARVRLPCLEPQTGSVDYKAGGQAFDYTEVRCEV